MKHSFLVRGNPIVFNAELAVAIGLNEAIVLQKIAFLLDRTESGKELKHDGEHWLFNTYEQWQKQFFPFFSLHTVQRTFQELEIKGLLISCQPEGGISRRKYYRIGEGAEMHLNSERLDDVAKLAPSGCSQIGSFDDPNRLLPLTGKTSGKTSVKHTIRPSVHFDTKQVEAIYELYPVKNGGRPSAIRAIRKALEKTGYDDLLQKTAAYAQAISQWPRSARIYVPHASTWFNDERYNGDPATWVRHEKKEEATTNEIPGFWK